MAELGAIVITGASTGIGAACAVGLAERGYQVFAGVRRPDDGARLEAAQAGVKALMIDVTDAASIEAARARVERELRGTPLRGLFNNAGISVAGPLEFVKPEELRRQLEVNCVGQLAVTQAFLPMLRLAKGRIITTGSVSGFLASPMMGPYSMSKFAIEAFSDSLRAELLPQGIDVVLLEPAAIATDMWDKGVQFSQPMFHDPPPGFEERYGGFVAGVQKLFDQGKREAAPPQVVLDAVIHALESRKPKTRYVMGTGIRRRKLLSRLPDRLRDKALLNLFGVKVR